MVCYYLVMHKEGQDFWSYLEILGKEIHAEIVEGLLVFFLHLLSTFRKSNIFCGDRNLLF